MGCAATTLDDRSGSIATLGVRSTMGGRDKPDHDSGDVAAVVPHLVLGPSRRTECNARWVLGTLGIRRGQTSPRMTGVGAAT
jgi:hypothetical protein